jgi:hypothetical protein
MSCRYLLGASLVMILAGCQSTHYPSNRIGPLAPDNPSPDLSSDGGQDLDAGPFAGVDPTVAHFFNTASLANDESAALAATQDGGANADAGN